MVFITIVTGVYQPIDTWVGVATAHIVSTFGELSQEIEEEYRKAEKVNATQRTGLQFVGLPCFHRTRKHVDPMDPWPLSEKVQKNLQIIVNYTPNTS